MSYPLPGYLRRVKLARANAVGDHRPMALGYTLRILAEGVLLLILASVLVGCRPSCEQLQQAVQIARTISPAALQIAVDELVKAFPGGTCAIPEPPAPPTPPPVTEPPSPPPTTLPPTPPPSASAPLIPDEELTAQEPQDGGRVTWIAIEAAINRWRRAHPEAWRADGACLINGAAGIDAAFQAISDELLSKGITAGQSIDRGGKRSDCIFVGRTDSSRVYEEAHLFDYSRACVVTGPQGIKGTWIRVPGGTQPTPEPTVTPGPEPQTACPMPRPGEPLGPCGLGKIAAKTHTTRRFSAAEDPNHCGASGDVLRLVDSTVQIKCYKDVPQPNFCALIGSYVPGTQSGNMWCPARLEGSPERVACELWALRAKGSNVPGAYVWKSNGCVLPHPDNMAQAACLPNGCALWVCNTDGSVCSDRVTP